MTLSHNFRHYFLHIESLEAFTANGKHYLASEHSGDVDVWNFSNNQRVAMFDTTPKNPVFLFTKWGMQMIARISGYTIEIWKLSTQAKVCTLLEENDIDERVNVMTIYEMNNKRILLAYNQYGVMTFWDLDQYELISSFDSDEGYVTELHVYYRDRKPILVGRFEDGMD